MGGINKAILLGNAGKDAELRYTAKGTAQTQFSLAVNSRSNGEDVTEWFNIVLWGDLAENLAQHITKGKQLYVEGKITQRSWDDDKGVKHYRTEIIGFTVQLLGGGADDRGSGGGQRTPRAAPQQARGAQQTAPARQRNSYRNAAPRGGGYDAGMPPDEIDMIDIGDLPFE